MLKICEKGHSHTHCIRFLNLKLWYIVQFNSPDMFHRCLTLAELSFSMYNYDEHSNALITLYGSDRGLETIAIGNSFVNLLIILLYNNIIIIRCCI